MHLGHQLVDRLIGYGVRHVFGCPGGQTLPLYNGIFSRPGEIEHVLMHDERSGAFAADAYARATGRIGVCDATVGPGASNLVSGLVEAYSSSIPVLAIVSDIPLEWEHRRAHGSASQAFEQRRFLEGCVKYYGRVQSPDSLPEMLHACVRIATSGRPGPTVLEIPDDLFAGEFGAEPGFETAADWAVYPRLRSAPDRDEVERAVALLQRSRKPMIIAGGGARHAGAEAEIADLVQLLGCPVATTLTGKGIISEADPMCVGVVGRFGVPMANASAEEADCVIYVGCKTGQTTTLSWTLPYLDTPVIHIDIDPNEIGRNYHDCVALLSDAKLGCAALADALRGRGPTTEWDLGTVVAIREAWWDGPIEFQVPAVENVLKPQQLVRVLRDAMADQDLLVSDASLASGWIGAHWQVRTPGRRFFAPRGLAGLGWGLPAAIGVSEALATVKHDGRSPRVVCLAGDGGWSYSMAEVETAARRKLPIVSVVLNNSTLGWTKHAGGTRYGGEVVSQDFIEVSYADAAAALGARTVSVDDIQDFENAVKTAMTDGSDLPWVIEARTCDIETPVLPSRVDSKADGAY